MNIKFHLSLSLSFSLLFLFSGIATNPASFAGTNGYSTMVVPHSIADLSKGDSGFRYNSKAGKISGLSGKAIADFASRHVYNETTQAIGPYNDNYDRVVRPSGYLTTPSRYGSNGCAHAISKVIRDSGASMPFHDLDSDIVSSFINTYGLARIRIFKNSPDFFDIDRLPAGVIVVMVRQPDSHNRHMGVVIKVTWDGQRASVIAANTGLPQYRLADGRGQFRVQFMGGELKSYNYDGENGGLDSDYARFIVLYPPDVAVP